MCHKALYDLSTGCSLFHVGACGCYSFSFLQDVCLLRSIGSFVSIISTLMN